MSTLTTADVQATYFARSIATMARTERVSPAEMVAELANTPAEARAMQADFEHGTNLLRNYTLVESDRSTAGGLLREDQRARVISPTIQVEAGHVGTSAAYCEIGLAPR